MTVKESIQEFAEEQGLTLEETNDLIEEYCRRQKEKQH